MKKRTNSASSLKTLTACLLRYYKRYEERAPSLEGVENDHLPLGRAVHAGLEEMYKRHMDRPEGARFSAQDYDEIYVIFMKEAVEGGLSNPTLLKEAWTWVKVRLDKFDYSDKLLGTEQFFDLVTDKGTKFLGHIDKVVEIDDDTIAIVDYKTSKTALTQHEADADIQMSMYDLAASILWPQYSTIILVFDYVRLGEVVMTYRDTEARTMFVDWLDLQDERIVSITKAQAKPSLHQFCGWCGYRHQCPAYRAAATCFDEESFLLGEDSEEDMIAKWEKLKNVKRAVLGAERDVRMQLDVLLSKKETGEMHGSKNRIYRSQSTRTSYDVYEVKDVLPPEDLHKVCTVNKSAMERYMADRPELASKIKNMAKVSYTAASIRTASNKSSRYGK